MNVIHLDEQTGWRGGEQQASWLIQGTVKKGHQVWICGKPDSPFMTADHGGAEIQRVPLPFWSEIDLVTAFKVAQLALQEDIDIIHAHTSHTHMIACLAGRLARRPSIVVSRRVSFPPKTDFVNRWKYNTPDRILAVSEKVAEVLREGGIPPNKVVRVYSSIDTRRLAVEAADRDEFGIAPDAILLLNAGALVGHKDHATLLDALAIVREQVENVHLLIAGEGTLRDALEKRIASLDLEGQVTLAGERDDVPQWMHAADCYVSSSWSEGLGTSVLEALACETPVVATEAGGVGEMILPGKTGYLVPNRDPQALADAIIASLEHPDEAQVMARAGRKHVESVFSTSAMVEATLAQYHTLVAEKLGIAT